MGRQFKILYADLSKRKIDSEDLDDGVVRKYLGGPGLAAKILWDETDARTIPLSKENRVVFAIGPLSGTVVPNSSRFSAAGLSPLTGIWGEAHGGGTWGHALSCTPFIGIVIKGTADTPVYLSIDNDKAELKDAGMLWGKDTYEVHDLLKKKDEQASVLTIGQAGERLIKFASVMGDGSAARAVARCGLGAVLGYQNLKAIAVKGSQKPWVKSEEQLRESVNRYFPKVFFNPQKYKEKNDETWTYHAERRGCIKNWTEGEFNGFGEKLAEMGMKGEPYYCKGCRTSCLPSHTYRGQRHFHGEFTLPFGSNCLIDDVDALLEANELCNRYGVDTQSAGHVIAFAMDLFDRGIITGMDTDGIELVWGDSQAMLQMLRNILERRGIGEILGEGIRAAAQHIGGRAAEYAIHVKGLEFPLFDPRCNNSYALQFATANRGADHLDGFTGLYGHGMLSSHTNAWIGSYLDDEDARKAAVDPFAVRGKGKLVAWAQNFDAVLENIGICKFLAISMPWVREPKEHFTGIKPEQFLEWLNLATGWDLDRVEFLKAGERVFNLKRMINVRRGISRKDDTLPMRFLSRRRGGKGPQAENLPPLGMMLNEYYIHRGWSEEGIPMKKKLLELGLEDISIPGLDKITPLC